MPFRKRPSHALARAGRVSLYRRHSVWWVYYRDNGQPVRRKIGPDREAAEQAAAQDNAQLTTGAPTMLAFTAISVPDLRQQFLTHHEDMLKSAVAAIRRYRAATSHLQEYGLRQPQPPKAHEVRAEAFAAYLRAVEVAPNGHPKATRRRLRDKGVRFILENKTALGCRIKSGGERDVPVLPEVVGVRRRVNGERRSGPVFLRKRFSTALPSLVADRRDLERICAERQRQAGRQLSRAELLWIARTVWRNAAALSRCETCSRISVRKGSRNSYSASGTSLG